ncbi:MAG TPA: histidine phosphatase family protein [Pseudonocardiaceae bacterium]
MTGAQAPDFALVFLVRHGQAAVPDENGRYSSEKPVPLTDAGVRQAVDAAELLRGANIDAIVSSDMLRAQQTAQIIGDAVGVEVAWDRRLREVATGSLDGARLVDLERDHPRFVPWIRSGFRQGFSGAAGHFDARLRFPGGESVTDASERAVAAFREIAAAHLGGCVAVVSHSWVTSAILCHVLGLPVTEYFRFGLANAGVALVRVGGDGRGMLDGLNLAASLGVVAGGAVPQRVALGGDGR